MPSLATWLSCAIALAVAPSALAQSVELLNAYQQFEAAKSANDMPEALKDGRRALALTESSADTDPRAHIDMLLSLAEVAARAGEEPEAAQLYERALTLQEAQLGADHPDLVPTLSALVALDLKQQHYIDAEARLNRMLAIERAAYGEHHENVLATLKQLREVYRAGEQPDAVADVDAQIERWQQSTRAFEVPLEAAGKDRRYKQVNGHATVRVFYGTNRAPSGSVKPAEYYGKGRGELQYGYLDVTIPKTHRQAELETQPRWSMYTLTASDQDLQSHYILLEQVKPLPRDAFLRELRSQIKAAPSQDVFVFVHGYNCSFEDAARRTAQLAYDLDFDGTPIMYSWPSVGSTTAYTVDEASVGVSGRKMADFLEDVLTQSGAQRVHLIAHSMGNRALIEALQTYLARRAPSSRQTLFGQIIFTAPDVDRDYFVDVVKSLHGTATRITLYASDKDLALRTSQALHGAPRAGTAGQGIVVLPGLDTIDMSSVPADSLGHSYFATNAGAIFDLFRLLWRGDPPPRRCGMSGRVAAGSVWAFNSDVCKGDDLLAAGVLLKRFGDLARSYVVNNVASVTDPSVKQQWTQILTRLDGLMAPGAQTLGVASP